MFRQRAAGEPTHVPLATAIIVPATTEIHLWVCNDTIILMPARRIALRISECHRGGEQVSVFSIVFGTIESDPVGTSIAFGWDADRVQFHTAGQSAMNNDTVSQSRTFRRGNPILQQATKVITSGLRTRHSVPPSCRGGGGILGRIRIFSRDRLFPDNVMQGRWSCDKQLRLWRHLAVRMEERPMEH